MSDQAYDQQRQDILDRVARKEISHEEAKRQADELVAPGSKTFLGDGPDRQLKLAAIAIAVLLLLGVVALVISARAAPQPKDVVDQMNQGTQTQQ